MRELKLNKMRVMETPILLTDDMDIRNTELSMSHGNNGDYYICLKETKRGEIVKLDTRIAMSGGNATPEIRQAVSNLFKALMGQKVDIKEENTLLTDNMRHVCPECKGYGNVIGGIDCNIKCPTCNGSGQIEI
jgi:hypothetical protein